MVERQLFPGVNPILSIAAADYINGERSEASMLALSPDWQAVVDLYDVEEG